MDRNEPSKYIEKIVLEILDRPWFWFYQWRDRKIEKFNISRFNARQAAYAFLRQYDGESFVKAQKVIVSYNNHELRLCVRDLIYGKINKVSNTTVEFIYRKVMFSEIKWPVITGNKINRVRWASDNNEPSKIPENHMDGDSSLINVDTRVLPCTSCNNLNNDQSLSMNSNPENTVTSFCQECRVRRGVSDLQKLINSKEGDLTLGHGTDNENHFRSSIYVHVNQNNNP